jgi:hypothetical protein
MQQVAAFLVETYPNQFKYQTKHRRRHIRNELTMQDFSLDRPFYYHPLEVCARLAMEDFQVFGKR